MGRTKTIKRKGQGRTTATGARWTAPVPEAVAPKRWEKHQADPPLELRGRPPKLRGRPPKLRGRPPKLRGRPPGPRPQGVLTALCAAVTATYQGEGDLLRPGVVVSCLSHDPPRFYASVVRYPHGDHKRVVLKVGDQGAAEQFATAEAAVLALAKTWEAQHRPPPTRETLAALSRALR